MLELVLQSLKFDGLKIIPFAISLPETFSPKLHFEGQWFLATLIRISNNVLDIVHSIFLLQVLNIN